MMIDDDVYHYCSNYCDDMVMEKIPTNSKAVGFVIQRLTGLGFLNLIPTISKAVGFVIQRLTGLGFCICPPPSPPCLPNSLLICFSYDEDDDDDDYDDYDDGL